MIKRVTIVRLGLAVACGLLLLFSPPAMGSGSELEPELGVFGGVSPPQPYDLLLAETLEANDAYRLCQFVVMPSDEAESAVYIVHPAEGSPHVISRALKQQLWTAMMEKMSDLQGASVRLDASFQWAALRQLKIETVVHDAELDAATVELLSSACHAALLHVRYPKTHQPTLDGVSFHISHWVPGAVSAGVTHSPTKGTLAADLVDLGLALQSYAAADPSARGAIKADLLAKARRLVRRAKTEK